MIEIDKDATFEDLVREFLMMSEEKRVLVAERLEFILAALDYAVYLDENQNIH